MSPRCQECRGTGASFVPDGFGTLRTDACHRCATKAEVEYQTYADLAERRPVLTLRRAA